MKYSIDKQEKYCLIKLDEEKLDSSLAPRFKSEILTIHAEGYRNIIIDISAVKYIDSSGLSALLVGHRVATESNGDFILTGVGDFVEKLIKISQLDKVLEMVPTVEESVDLVFMNELERDLGQSSE